MPPGRWQIETGLVDWTRDGSDGGISELTFIGASLIKYGINDRADVELGVAPYERLRGSGAHTSGLGDMLVRTKWRLTQEDATVQIAVDPFVKLPTAKHDLGNGKIEAGLTLPVSVELGAGPFSLAISPELDWLADADGHGRHVAMVQLVDLGIAATDRLSVSAELWSEWDWDPAGTARQVSADGAVAYLIANSLQLDAGANLGLNDQTPDAEVYAGVSKRF